MSFASTQDRFCSSFTTTAWALLLLGVLAPSGGCIALGIPSKRFHDPNDHGGLFGDWKRGQPQHPAHPSESLLGGDASLSLHSETYCEGPGCEMAHDEYVMPIEMPVETECGSGVTAHSAGKEKPPEVPWPRFHPVPTRPIFE